jgi:general secretion pathway protein E
MEAVGKLGQILLQETSLKEEQLNEALREQEETGGKLGEILLRKKFIKPNEILKGLCKQLGMPFQEDLSAGEIDPKIVDPLPINFCKTHNLMPVLHTGTTLTVAISNPTSLEPLEDLRKLYNVKITTIVSPANVIQEAINTVYEKSSSHLIADIEEEYQEDVNLDDVVDILDATENDAPIIKFVNSIILRAIKERASDIHITPYEKFVVVRFRIDGVLYDVIRQPKKAHAAIASRIKVMGNLDIAEKRLPQDGRISIKMAGKDIDVRLNTVPTVYGERLVMRLLEKTNVVLDLGTLGFTKVNLEKLRKLINHKHGIVLITGPTGSGKSTTLSASINEITKGGTNTDLNIITVEDPVEYQLKGVSQIQVNSKIDLHFSTALRAILRQDPDVVMIGETRDKETAEIAINASLTGHLVFSTLHTNDSAGAPPRLIDMGVEPFLVASSLLGVVAQRLMRTLCPHCRESYQPTVDELLQLNVTQVSNTPTFYRSKGCKECNGKGYTGRTVITEVMMVTEEIRNLVLTNADSGQLRKKAVEQGMQTMWENGVEKVYAGITSSDELIRSIQQDD